MPPDARSSSSDEPPPEPDPSVRRAIAALLALDGALDDAEPLRAMLWRFAGEHARPGPAGPVLEFWERRVPGNPRSAARYRWELSHRVGVKMPPYAPSERAWRAWRKGEQAPLERDPFEVEARLLAPVVVCENLGFLLEHAASGGPDAARAAALASEAAPIARRDVARYVAMNDAWEDTFALWCVTRAPRVLDLLHPLAVAIAASYAAGQHGPILGARFPYYRAPLVSASAQLASALLALGADVDLAAELARFVGEQRRASGGWSDDPDGEDPLTTLIAADLLASSDPAFELAPTLGFLAACQGADGLWRGLGPDAPWLTAEVVRLALAARRPFAARFRWPQRARAVIDQKTGVPSFAYFTEVAELLARVPGLARATVQLAFIDLIGFRAFNNRHGQDAGDDVLRAFADELATVPLARVVRDGGDELLVVGAPERPPLEADLRAFMARWTARFAATFGDDVAPVVPRIVVGECPGSGLRALRQELGRAITALKELSSIPPDGVLVSRPA